MNERQRDRFLWEWSRRRAHGRLKIALLGAGIGATGGLVFTILMFALPALAGQEFGRLNTESMAPFLAVIAETFGPFGFVFLMAAPAFGFLGAIMADRVFSLQESQYQNYLAEGARVPSEAPPPLTLKDRLPALIVLGIFVALAIFLLTMTWRELTRGNL